MYNFFFALVLRIETWCFYHLQWHPYIVDVDLVWSGPVGSVGLFRLRFTFWMSLHWKNYGRVVSAGGVNKRLMIENRLQTNRNAVGITLNSGFYYVYEFSAA